METKTMRKVGLWGGAAIVVALLWTVVAYNVSTAPKPRPATVTADTQTRKASSDTVSGLLAVDEAAYNEMISAQYAGDKAALLRLGVDGRVFMVEPGTPVRTIDGGMFKKRVSVLSGNHAGRTGWVPNS